MSCMSFLSPQQRATLAASSHGDGAAPLSTFVSPPPSAGKVRRLRVLSASADPAIRESAALSRQAPADVLDALARDPCRDVRGCVARNPRASPAVLRDLGGDASPFVRGWVAANPRTPGDVLAGLADDKDATVRSLVVWARGSARCPE